MIRVFTALLAIAVAGDAPAQLIGMPPPSKQREFGWAGPAEVKAARIALGDAFPKEYGTQGERVITADEYEGKYVVLWSFTRDRNGGQHWPTIRQLIGDCVSHGWSHGALATLAVHLCTTGDPATLSKPYTPYIYGTSRVQVGGGRIRGDGSVGTWAAAAAKEFGYVDEKTPGLPPYTAATAREWGRRGPPQEFLTIGKRSLADVRLIRTWDEAVSAIATGHAIPVCSGVGFEKIVERNGRIEGVRSGSWPHCMCFIGVDARSGREALYCWNSWGPDAHAPEESYARLDGAPPGGFWVMRADVERMLKEEDSFAVSFSGFKSPPLWRLNDKEVEDNAPLAILESRRARVGDLLSLRRGNARAEYRLAN
jgi:hypothetical protein